VDFGGIGSAFLGPRAPGPDASPTEQAAAAIAQLLFPALLFCLIAFAGLGHHEVAAWSLMALLSVAGYVIARFLSDRLGFALVTAFLGTLWNFVGTASGFLVGGLIEFLRTF
jgi:hypothetical protein